jgi:Cu(I)/Ag(I) efflux system membrane fusion protein
MKNYIVYILFLLAGLAIGIFVFNPSEKNKATQHTEHNVNTDERWTCSMHPQINQPEFGSCPICGMDLIPASDAGDTANKAQFKLSKNALALANVETSLVKIATNESQKLVLNGVIAENETQTAVQTAHFPGRIEKLYISAAGEKVSKGTLLATVYSPELALAQKELLTAAQFKETQPNLYNAVKNKLTLWKLSTAQIEALEQSKQIVSQFNIYATVSGTVIEKLVEEGAYIKQGTALFNISNLNTVWANFDVFEKDLSLVKIGSKVTVVTNTVPPKEIEHTITFIHPVLQTATRTAIARVELKNEKNNLKPGMFVKGIVDLNNTTEKNNLLHIPKSAVLWTGKRSVVYVKVNAAHTFEMREVTLGQTFENAIEVLDGLKENEEIVTNGTFTVDAAAQLAGKKSMMNRELNKVEEKSATLLFSGDLSVNDSEKNKLTPLFAAYFELKDYLVNDNFELAQKSAVQLAQLNNTLNVQFTDKKTQEVWMSYHKEIAKNTEHVAHNNSITALRASFMAISNTFIPMAKTFGIGNGNAFVQFCPMANSDNGAQWLSKENNVLNPYFGAAMLYCGSVTDTITK